MTKERWSLTHVRSSGNGAHDAPEDVVVSEGCTQERKKLTMVKAQAYLKATKTKKSQMLDDFCASTGYQRTYAARVLHQAAQRYVLGETILVADPGKHIKRHRPPRYGPLVQQALITIWAASTFLGPVRLAAGMPLFVENLTTHGHLPVDEETRRLLLQMSPATIGRLLAGERKMYRLHGSSHTRSTLLGGRIPLQTCMDPLPEDVGPIPPRMLLYSRGVFGGVLYPVHACWHGWMCLKKQSNSCDQQVQNWTWRA